MPTNGDSHPAGPGRRSLPGVRPALLAGGFALGLTALAAGQAGVQTPPPSGEADGRVHVSLVLEGQALSVAFPPDLAANEPAYAELLAGAPVRLGVFEGHRALRIGTLAPDLAALAAERAEAAARAAAPAREEPAAQARAAEDEAAAEDETADAAEPPAPAGPPSPELWIARDAEGWRLEIRTPGADGGDGTVHGVPLNHAVTAPRPGVHRVRARHRGRDGPAGPPLGAPGVERRLPVRRAAAAAPPAAGLGPRDPPAGVGRQPPDGPEQHAQRAQRDGAGAARRGAHLDAVLEGAWTSRTRTIRASPRPPAGRSSR